MKTRDGFVSNSSSSSFVCDVCGESGDNEESRTCENGHDMCEHHVKKTDVEDEGDDVDARNCPICSMDRLMSGDKIAYLMKKHGHSDKALLEGIKAEFGDYKSFKAYLNAR